MEWLLGNHPAFNEGPKVSANDMLWAEFNACWKMGIDPDVMFAKNREMRALITGGVIAGGAIESMRTYDIAKAREAERARHK